MEARHNLNRAVRQDPANFNNQAFESTNPFQNPSGSMVQQSQSNGKHGKRPRIMKPLYSARLS